MTVSNFKPDVQIFGDLGSCEGAFDRVPFGQFMMNSIIISDVTVVGGLILATLIVPVETLALPLLWWVNKLPFLGPDDQTQRRIVGEHQEGLFPERTALTNPNSG